MFDIVHNGANDIIHSDAGYTGRGAQLIGKCNLPIVPPVVGLALARVDKIDIELFRVFLASLPCRRLQEFGIGPCFRRVERQTTPNMVLAPVHKCLEQVLHGNNAKRDLACGRWDQ